MRIFLGQWLTALVMVVPNILWAQPVKTLPSLADLYTEAWQRHPAYAALAARQTQYETSRQLAQSVIASAPSASLGYRGDTTSSPTARNGLREWELGISTPLAIGERRHFATETARQQANVYAAEVNHAQWLLAGEVREAYWAWQLSHIEHLLLDDEVKRAEVLVNDSARRTKAGETPRVDTLQAESLLGLAKVSQAEALQKETHALSALQRLTGPKLLVSLSDAALGTYQSEVLKNQKLSAHPVLSALEAQQLLAKTKLESAIRVRGEAPVLGTGLARESNNTPITQTSARISLGFTFGGDARYAPKIAEASAEAIEREVLLIRGNEQLTQDISVATIALQTTEQKKSLAQRRAATSIETAQLFAKAFALGELDMPARLRAETDRASAVLAANRAAIESAAAISKLNQILGYLP